MKTKIETNERLERMERMLEELLKKQDDNENYIPFGEAAKYLCVSESTLYKLTGECRIRFYKPNGKMIYFRKSQLNEWIENRPAVKKMEAIRPRSGGANMKKKQVKK